MPPSGVLLHAVLTVLFAGLVRGYGGFGFSAIVVISLTLVLPPNQVVPFVLLLEIAASIWMLPRVWRQVDWRGLIWLGIGVVIGTPVGGYMLANFPVTPMRGAIAVVVLVLAGLLWRGFSFSRMPGPAVITALGVVAGILNSSAAIGGLPVMLFYLSSPAEAAVGRATVVTFLLGTCVASFIACMTNHLVSMVTFQMAGTLVIPMVVGVVFGTRFFRQTREKVFRRLVLLLIMLLSLIALVRAVWG